MLPAKWRGVRIQSQENHIVPMKNQYIGDINDYRKYGLLRRLTGRGLLSGVVCWMLTPDDGSRDGGRVRYLYEPERWRCFDPELYDFLRETLIVRATRHIDALHDSVVLPGFRFFPDLIPVDSTERERFFCRLHDFAAGVEFIYFDPDTGLKRQSANCSKRPSPRHLHCNEVVDSFRAGYSLLVYQHFPRRRRSSFVRGTVRWLGEAVGASRIYSYGTSTAIFLLIPQERHLDFFSDRNQDISAAWQGQIDVKEHDLSARNRSKGDGVSRSGLPACRAPLGAGRAEAL